DPDACLDLLTTLDSGSLTGVAGIRSVTESLRGASKKDPEAALAAIDGLPEELKMTALGSVLVGWADKHPVDALSWAVANGIHVSDAKGSMNFHESGMSWRTMIMVAFDRDREKTMEWIRSQPPSAERDSRLRAGLWGGTMDQRLQIYAELTPASQVSAAGVMVQGSFRYGSDGQSGIEAWVREQPPGSVRTAAIRTLSEYQASNPDKLNQIAESWTPGPDRDAANRGIVRVLAYKDAPSAIEFARQISNPATRESAFEQIAQEWFSENKAAARTWVTTSPEFSSEQKRVLLRQAEEQ